MKKCIYIYIYTHSELYVIETLCNTLETVQNLNQKYFNFKIKWKCTLLRENKVTLC